MSHRFTLRRENINANVLNCKYDVRGEIYLAAVERAKSGKEVIYTNVGNPHALGEKPLSFNRQVLSLLMSPDLIENPAAEALFAPDAIIRARGYQSKLNGGVGAYQDSKGNAFIRQEIADFISGVSGQPSDPATIFISNGAGECAKMLLYAMIRGSTDGIMVPIPQYPLYSAAIGLFNGALVPYYLDEENGWAMDVQALQESIDEARDKGILCRALVFINPGNPTGQCLTAENIEQLITFCFENRLVLCADEVYQENVYNPARPFVSARKVLGGMAEPIRSGLELVSLHTVSKGSYGECGLRGGYMELHNMDPQVVDEIYKTASINLSPNVPGQVALGLMVNPPRPGDFSHDQYFREKGRVLESLKRRAKMVTDSFNKLEGVSCQEVEGAMYSFPQITIPPKAAERAAALGKAPDVMYCLELLEETGLSTVPGSGFKQRDGTFHFRTTILPQEEKFGDILHKFTTFHEGFMRRYGGSGPRAKL